MSSRREARCRGGGSSRGPSTAFWIWPRGGPGRSRQSWHRPLSRSMHARSTGGPTTRGNPRNICCWSSATMSRSSCPASQDRSGAEVRWGARKPDPELSKLGGTAWQGRKDRVAQAVMDLASDMIQLQAVREATPGFAFPPDTDWQASFEEAFPYQETPDQLTSLTEIKSDMQRARPMDRLICGDVGYGKTELAVRAAFKAVDNGKQVAVLVPTTVLAEQHGRTFGQHGWRTIRSLSNASVAFCTAAEVSSAHHQRAWPRAASISSSARTGWSAPMYTFAILDWSSSTKSSCVLALSTRNGWKLRRLRQQVDVLTLTATPDPADAASISSGDPRNQQPGDTCRRIDWPSKTRIVRSDPQPIRHAVLRRVEPRGAV